MVTDYAEIVVNDVLNVLGEHCAEMLEFGAEQVIIRLLHVLAAVKHYEREVDDPRVFGEVAEHLHQLSRRSPGLLNVVLQERRVVEDKNARH
jgi:hypothetical protein